jgi:hypothetical protein
VRSKTTVSPNEIAIGNQPRRAIATKVIPTPLNQNEDPVFELHQLHEVHKKPGKPSDKSGELQPA